MNPVGTFGRCVACAAPRRWQAKNVDSGPMWHKLLQGPPDGPNSIPQIVQHSDTSSPPQDCPRNLHHLALPSVFSWKCKPRPSRNDPNQLPQAQRVWPCLLSMQVQTETPPTAFGSGPIWPESLEVPSLASNFGGCPRVKSARCLGKPVATDILERIASLTSRL